MDNIRIRSVDIKDAETLAYIQTESWKSAFYCILPAEQLEKYTDIEMVRKSYGTILESEMYNGLLLLVEGKAQGLAFWGSARDEEMMSYAELICIHSLQDKWRMGYGSALMEYILKEVKNAGYNKIYLWVFVENKRACKFYEKFGFLKSEKTKKFHDAVEIMYYRELK